MGELRSGDSSSNRNSEKERSFAQMKPSTLQRSSSVSQLLRHVVQGSARCPADHAHLKVGMAPQRADIQHAPSLTFRVHLVIASFEQWGTGTCEFHRMVMFCGQQLSDPHENSV